MVQLCRLFQLVISDPRSQLVQLLLDTEMQIFLALFAKTNIFMYLYLGILFSFQVPLLPDCGKIQEEIKLHLINLIFQNK